MSRRPIGRRAFLRLALLACIGGLAVATKKVYEPIGPVNFLRWMARGRWMEATSSPARVALGQCGTYDADVLDCLRSLWRQADMPDVRGKRVLVKPNLIDVLEGQPITTSPTVVGALLDLLGELGVGEVVVGDGPGFRREAWPIVRATGLATELATRRVAFVDLNYDDPQPVRTVDGWFLDAPYVWLPRHVIEADLVISVPKLKTHHWTGVSLGLKNLFGIVPGMRYGWPKNFLHVNGIPLSILGLYQLARPMVTVVDGLVGMQGDGPLFGTPVDHGVLAVGADPVAVDVVAARLMGFDSAEAGHLMLADFAGLGNAKQIEVRGETEGDLRRDYERPPSVAAKVDSADMALAQLAARLERMV